MFRLTTIRGTVSAICLLAATACRGELVVQQKESIFDVDGLMADGLDLDASRTGKYFHAEVKQYPLIDNSRPATALRLPPMPSTIRAGTPPAGAAMERMKAADVYATQQDWGKALNEIQQALELEPDNMMLIRRGAAVAALARKFGAADEFFRRVIDASPGDVSFLAGRAGVLIRLLRLDEADQMVQRALAIDPRYLAARFDRVCIQIARGDSEPDRSEWDRLSTDDLLQVANWLDADQADYIGALSEAGFGTLCDTVLGKGTRSVLKVVLETLRQVNGTLREGQWEGAEKALRELIAMGVVTAGVEMDLARVEFEQGKKDAAEASLKDLAARYPNMASVLYNQGFVLLAMEKFPEASAILEKELQLDPNDAQARFALACAYAAQGLMDKAWPLLQQLAASNPSDIRLWLVGDEPYLVAIRKDPRFSELVAGSARAAAPSKKPAP